MFEGDEDIWWVTGGWNGETINSTEVYTVDDNDFEFGVDLPRPLGYHNLVNVNNTHMVVLGGYDVTNLVFMIDRCS